MTEIFFNQYLNFIDFNQNYFVIEIAFKYSLHRYFNLIDLILMILSLKLL